MKKINPKSLINFRKSLKISFLKTPDALTTNEPAGVSGKGREVYSFRQIH